MIVIVCVNTALVLPQSSVTVHVLVYVPACGHDPATKPPDVLLIFVTSPSQLSVATGKKPCAAVSPAASSHSSVVSREFAGVVHTGAVVSMIFTVSSQVEPHPLASVIVNFSVNEVLQPEPATTVTVWSSSSPAAIVALPAVISHK